MTAWKRIFSAQMRRLLAVMLCLGLLAGCVPNVDRPEPKPPDKPSSSSESQPETSAPESASEPESRPYSEPNDLHGSGEFSYDKSVFERDELLDQEQQQLIMDFMTLYYESMAVLVPQSPHHLFDEKSQVQAIGNNAVWAAVISVREMQYTDLSLVSYHFRLKCNSITDINEDTVEVSIVESSIQNFAAHPGVDSESFNIRHTFTLHYYGGEWKIQRHYCADYVYSTVLGKYHDDAVAAAANEEEAELYFYQRSNEYLVAAAEYVDERLTKGQDYSDATADHPYNRTAAVNYSLEWVGERNPDWPVYDQWGGNCQNFVSQALLAGGIPMDPRSPGVWKWYSETTNNQASTVGRSSSWANVNRFLDYIKQNNGYGLVALPNAAYYSGKPGDIINLGTDDLWRHTVIISELVLDDEGTTIDYLVNSNTGDLRNYPVGAYLYANQMLIRVIGWDD